MTQSKEAKALGYASPAAMIRVFQGFMLLQLSFCIMYAKDTAAPFEIMLTSVGDKLIEYETKKYETQRLVAFSNQPATDPFTYPEDVARLYDKYAFINTENISGTDK